MNSSVNSLDFVVIRYHPRLSLNQGIGNLFIANRRLICSTKSRQLDGFTGLYGFIGRQYDPQAVHGNLHVIGETEVFTDRS